MTGSEKSIYAPSKFTANRLFVMSLFAKVNIAAACGAGAVCGGLLIFLLTAVLLLKGAPPGDPVGPNLAALGTFVPGYAVTWSGSLAGALFGAVCGAAFGLAASVFWNFAHLIVIGVVALRGDWLESEG